MTTLAEIARYRRSLAPLLAPVCLVALCLVCADLAHGQVLKKSGPDIRVLSFNIRYNNPGDGPDAWPHRQEWVAEIVRGTDIGGFQEVLHSQLQDLEKSLPGYAWYGVGRDDGKARGEHVPICYLAERFELLDKSAFWLSETPEVAGSKSWDAAITRVTTWVKLRDRATQREFFVFNTHFDHVGVTARQQSARLLRAKIAEIAGQHPVVLLGDFNSLPTSDAYRIVTEAAGAEGGIALKDARALSATEPAGPDSTWNGFRKVTPGRRIDFIFVNDHWTVHAHQTLDEQRDGRFPSDHLPVFADLLLGPAPPDSAQ